MPEVRFYNADGSINAATHTALPVRVEIDGAGIIACLSGDEARDVAERILIHFAGSRARAAAALAMHPMQEPQKSSP